MKDTSVLIWKLCQAFKEGDVRFLIATDVAARGIDIAGLPYVINAALPDRAEDYIHRVGRVGALQSQNPFYEPGNQSQTPFHDPEIGQSTPMFTDLKQLIKTSGL